MAEPSEWIKILITAVVSALSTAVLAEPIKEKIKHWLAIRQVRRAIYCEVVHNYAALRRQVAMAKDHGEMVAGMGQGFAITYKRFAYDLGSKDSASFYRLGWNELYWLELLYRDFETVVSGSFISDDQRLRNATFASMQLIFLLKNRHLSQRLVFKVSPRAEREELKAELQKAGYLDIGPPRHAEKIRRKLDRLQYWWWRKNTLAPSVWLEVSAIIDRAAVLEQATEEYGGDASKMAKSDAAGSAAHSMDRSFHGAVYDYLLHKEGVEWRRWKKRGWVAWPDSRLLDVQPVELEADGSSCRDSQ